MFHFATDKMCSKEKGCPEMTQDGLEGIRLHIWPKGKRCRALNNIGPWLEGRSQILVMSYVQYPFIMQIIVKQKMFALTAILVKPDNCISLAAHAALQNITFIPRSLIRGLLLRAGEISSERDGTKKMMKNLNIIQISHLTFECS